jgi:transcriptional regulator with PAS, ATPase and Fis domain
VVNKKSLDLLQPYAWPDNIRELQNIIERRISQSLRVGFRGSLLQASRKANWS